MVEPLSLWETAVAGINPLPAPGRSWPRLIVVEPLFLSPLCPIPSLVPNTAGREHSRPHTARQMMTRLTERADRSNAGDIAAKRESNIGCIGEAGVVHDVCRRHDGARRATSLHARRSQGCVSRCKHRQRQADESMPVPSRGSRITACVLPLWYSSGQDSRSESRDPCRRDPTATSDPLHGLRSPYVGQMAIVRGHLSTAAWARIRIQRTGHQGSTPLLRYVRGRLGAENERPPSCMETLRGFPCPPPGVSEKFPHITA